MCRCCLGFTFTFAFLETGSCSIVYVRCYAVALFGWLHPFFVQHWRGSVNLPSTKCDHNFKRDLFKWQKVKEWPAPPPGELTEADGDSVFLESVTASLGFILCYASTWPPPIFPHSCYARHPPSLPTHPPWSALASLFNWTKSQSTLWIARFKILIYICRFTVWWCFSSFVKSFLRIGSELNSLSLFWCLSLLLLVMLQAAPKSKGVTHSFAELSSGGLPILRPHPLASEPSDGLSPCSS